MQRFWVILAAVLALGLSVPAMPGTAAIITLNDINNDQNLKNLPNNLKQLLADLKLGKLPVAFPEGPEPCCGPEDPVTRPVPDSFRFGAGGQLNPTGGSLLVLEGIPVPPPSDISELTPEFVSDIVVFPPNGKQFLMFSDPFPDPFRIPTYDRDGNVTGTANKSFEDLLTSGRVDASRKDS
jgi:hypothetical protein